MPEQNHTKITYSYPGNGTTKMFPILWPYIDRGFVRVLLQHNARDEEKEDITPSIRWITDSQIEVEPAPPTGSTLFITRKTPDGRALVIFRDGSTQMADDLNTIATQLIHMTEESRDYTAEVHDYVGKADGMLEKLVGLDEAVERAETAAMRADQVLNLSVAATDVPYGHMPYGSYNKDTGMLTLAVPQGKQGETGRDGQDGTNGKDGRDGEQGTPGVIIDVQAGMFALEIVNGDLILFHKDGTTPPNIYMSAEGNLIWEQA